MARTKARAVVASPFAAIADKYKAPPTLAYMELFCFEVRQAMEQFDETKEWKGRRYNVIYSPYRIIKPLQDLEQEIVNCHEAMTRRDSVGASDAGIRIGVAFERAMLAIRHPAAEPRKQVHRTKKRADRDSKIREMANELLDDKPHLTREAVYANVGKRFGVSKKTVQRAFEKEP